MIDQNDCKITIDYDFNYKHKDVPTVIVRLITAEGVKIVEIIQGKNIEGFLDLTSTLQDYGYKVVSQNRDRWIPVDEQLPKKDMPVFATIEDHWGTREVIEADYINGDFIRDKRYSLSLVIRTWQPRYVLAPFNPVNK